MMYHPYKSKEVREVLKNLDRSTVLRIILGITVINIIVLMINIFMEIL